MGEYTHPKGDVSDRRQDCAPPPWHEESPYLMQLRRLSAHHPTPLLSGPFSLHLFPPLLQPPPNWDITERILCFLTASLSSNKDSAMPIPATLEV